MAKKPKLIDRAEVIELVEKIVGNTKQREALIDAIEGLEVAAPGKDDPISKMRGAMRGVRTSLKGCVQPAKGPKAQNAPVDATRQREIDKGFKVRTEGESRRADEARQRRNSSK